MKCVNKYNKKVSFYQLLSFFILMLSAQMTWSLPNDGNQPIYIQSNKAEFNDKTGVATYIGNVKIKQGTLRVLADTVHVHRDSVEGVDKIVALGNPAHYRQQTEMNKDDLYAHAKKIEYYVKKEEIKLLKNAKIEQDGNVFTGERIDYFIKRKLVKANSDNNGRINMVIQPDSKPGK